MYNTCYNIIICITEKACYNMFMNLIYERLFAIAFSCASCALIVLRVFVVSLPKFYGHTLGDEFR